MSTGIFEKHYAEQADRRVLAHAIRTGEWPEGAPARLVIDRVVLVRSDLMEVDLGAPRIIAGAGFRVEAPRGFFAGERAGLFVRVRIYFRDGSHVEHEFDSCYLNYGVTFHVSWDVAIKDLRTNGGED